MNRFKIRLGLPARAVRVALAGAVAGLAVLLSGCGAGQVSQMAVQEPAINRNKVTFNNVALRDIRIQAVQTGDFLQPGRAVDLVAVAVNQSPNTPDKLVGITTDIGTVTLSGDTRLAGRRDAVHRHAGGPEGGARPDRLQHRGQGDGHAGQADHQRPDL